MRPLPLSFALLLAPCALASIASAQTLADRTLNTRFTYKATVPAQGGKSLDVWIPIPSDSELQKVTNLTVTSPFPHRITTETRHGNRMVYIRAENVSTPFDATVSFDVARRTAGVANIRRDGGPEAQAYTRPDRLVPIGGRYAEIADSVVGSRRSNFEKAQAIYEHTVATMQYDYNKESPHLGEGDVAFVCDYKKGNCSDLHSYIISLGRSEDVPMYLEYGFPITGIPVPDPIPATGKIGGYHCWTWFYDPDRGWLPLDASDGRRWLDAKRPDVKDKMMGQLVLERSAVAISRGRDIVLNPAQKSPPLNNFIYPYAEADGVPAEAKWELSYLLLDANAAGAAPSNQDLQRQINELRDLVRSQSEEIARLKSERDGGARPQAAVAVPTSERISAYGMVRADMAYDSMQASPNGQGPFFIQSPGNPNVGGKNDQFTMHAKLTRLGLNFTAPESTLPGWALTGKLEFDFQGGGSESRPNPRGRHMYLQAQRGPSTWLFGQTWDLISPLIPSPNDDTIMWNAGNLGDRRAQLRYSHDQRGNPLTFAVALGLTGAVDLKDLDGNGVRDGEDSGMPHFQGRVGWRSRAGGIGLWGHFAREELTNPVSGETSFESHSLGVDWQWRFTPLLDFRGEAWTGRNLSDFRGGIGQGVNTVVGREIRSSGGWAELGFDLSPRHRLALGYTLDDPEDGDVAAGGRTKNDAWYLHNRWQLGANLELGLNYLHWTTRYSGLSKGIDDRFNVYVTRRF